MICAIPSLPLNSLHSTDKKMHIFMRLFGGIPRRRLLRALRQLRSMQTATQGKSIFASHGCSGCHGQSGGGGVGLALTHISGQYQPAQFDGTFENAHCQDENWRHVSPDSE